MLNYIFIFHIEFQLFHIFLFYYFKYLSSSFISIFVFSIFVDISFLLSILYFDPERVRVSAYIHKTIDKRFRVAYDLRKDIAITVLLLLFIVFALSDLFMLCKRFK